MPGKEKLAIRSRIRVLSGEDVLLGPGKADLLEAIARTGSVKRAAAELEMSYMRAWSLVGVMNRGFRKPLVALDRGGSRRGGAALTREGAAVLTLYRKLEAASGAAMAPDWRRLRRHLSR
jgi:molybdate transport system regulatory protein